MRRGDIAQVWRIARTALALASAGLVAGCFQPLYGARPTAGGPGLRDSLGAIEVQQIAANNGSPDAFIAVQIRNDLIYDFTGGGSPAPPTHRLVVRIGGSLATVSIDRGTALPNAERYNLSATYSLTEIASGKTVVTGSAAAYAAFDTIGTQRFARLRGMRDAQRRAAKTISETITTRLASYFVAGT